MLAVVCPGQGSQNPGMLKSWSTSEIGKQISEMASQISNLDINYLGSLATKEEISDTSIAQVLISVSTLISAELLNIKKINADKVIVSGHSVGEISSYYLAGIYGLKDAIELVASRGKFMAEASMENPGTGMVAILGGDRNEILNELAAGKLDDIEKLFEHAPKNAKLIKLEVSAAFHSDFMFKAKDKFLKSINEIASNNLDFQLITNNQGKLVIDTKLAMRELVGQLTSPVRWDLCQETIKNAGVTGLLELAPGGTLVGIAKREIPGVELFAVKSLDDIPTGIDFIRKHTSE